MSKLGIYGTINARLRTRLSKSLDDEKISALVHAGSANEAFALLADTQYQDVAAAYAGSNDMRLIEQLLFEKEINSFSSIRNDLSGKPQEFADAFLARYEVEALKMALRAWFAGKREGGNTRVSPYVYGGFSRLQVDDLIIAEDLSEIAGILAGTPYGQVVQQAESRQTGRLSLFAVEIALDNRYFERLEAAIAVLDNTDGNLARRLIGVEIDLENLERIVRFRDLYKVDDAELANLLVPSANAAKLKRILAEAKGEDPVRTYVGAAFSDFAPLLEGMGSDRYANMVLLESLLEEILKREIRKSMLGVPFTLGIVLAYFFLVRRETRKILTILYAKHYGLDEERARSLI